ncbi:hypothetical protein CesoFtcFv8_019236 [Champsocephalus esox]|uniref:THAP domain-containing protein 1 n=1 Tax=Champsocephalus esox TaxID=159716 RepID=A0AAN8BHX7_9TELE|nr:hypothetical protein CesoFtcFv8_019236 [Champsocephalus esox]
MSIRAWIIIDQSMAVELEDYEPEPVLSSRLCSAHFEKDQFLEDNEYKPFKKGERRLKPTAVPTIFTFEGEKKGKEAKPSSPRLRPVASPSTQNTVKTPVAVVQGAPEDLIEGTTSRGVPEIPSPHAHETGADVGVERSLLLHLRVPQSSEAPGRGAAAAARRRGAQEDEDQVSADEENEVQPPGADDGGHGAPDQVEGSGGSPRCVQEVEQVLG